MVSRAPVPGKAGTPASGSGGNGVRHTVPGMLGMLCLWNAVSLNCYANQKNNIQEITSINNKIEMAARVEGSSIFFCKISCSALGAGL